MKTEVTDDFDFSRKQVQPSEIEKKPKISPGMAKGLKYSSFIIMGCVAIGVSFGLTNSLLTGYLIDKQAKSNTVQIQAKNEELRKNRQFELVLQNKAKQDEINAKEEKINALENEKLSVAQDKVDYNIYLKNKDGMIKNYESQLGMYDKAYQESVKGVKNGLLSLDDLTEVRNNYQEYKKTIHNLIKFINDATVSFEVFHNLTEDSRKGLDEELTDYQAGSINRNAELENALLKIADDSNDNEEDEKLAIARNNAKSSMIDDLADVMNNNSEITLVKKLKR